MDDGHLTAAERTGLLALARQTLHQRLNDSPVSAPEAADLSGLKRERGAFVTLSLAGNLRGCIGTFRAQKPLWKIVQEMAISAALHDPRFPPLRAAELDAIEIEISALTPLRIITDTDEIQVGTHGLYITQGHAGGVLLPQVAVEYGWSSTEFLQQTCRKAGLPSTAWQHGATIEVFSAEVFSESAPDGGKVSCA
jgi:uncharacterized protein